MLLVWGYICLILRPAIIRYFFIKFYFYYTNHIELKGLNIGLKELTLEHNCTLQYIQSKEKGIIVSFKLMFYLSENK